jgi:hypothetical protein
MSSNQRPDTLMQDRISQVDEKLLQRTAGPYIWVTSVESGPYVTGLLYSPTADVKRTG